MAQGEYAEQLSKALRTIAHITRAFKAPVMTNDPLAPDLIHAMGLIADISEHATYTYDYRKVEREKK